MIKRQIERRKLIDKGREWKVLLDAIDDSWREFSYSVMKSYTQRTGDSIISN